MGLFSFLKRTEFFSAEEKEKVLAAIRSAEQQTSGEIRLYVESKCRFVDPLDRAAEIFWGLRMDETEHRNAVLVYVAVRDHQYAIYADEGIYKKAGETFWHEKVAAMQHEFSKDNVAQAVVQVIQQIGQALQFHFPYERTTDKNELPDDIVFGE